MNLSIKMGQYGEASVLLDLGREFAQRALNEMGAGDDFVCPIPGYYVYDFGEDWVVLMSRSDLPTMCVGRVDDDVLTENFVFGIVVDVSVDYALDYTREPDELDLDARLTAARALRLALTAFGVIQ